MTIDFGDVRRRFSLRDQLARYGSPVRRDGRYKCVLPGHSHATHSQANVFDKDGIDHWRCHRCDKTGDVIDLIEQVEGLTTAEAIQKLTGERPTSRPPPPRQEDGPGLVFNLGPVGKGAPILRARYETPKMLTRRGKLVSYVPAFVFAYCLPDGREVGRVLRLNDASGGKNFTQARWCLDRQAWVNVGWAGDDRAPLYNAPELERRSTAPVLLVEGEKCVEHARACLKDWVVTCWVGGSSAVGRADFSQLAGREVTVWPDNDEPGLKAMKAALKAIQSDRLYWVEPSKDWQKNYDVADLIRDEGPGAPASWLKGRERREAKVEIDTSLWPGDWLPVSRGGWFPDDRFREMTREESPRLKVTSEINALTVLRCHPYFATLSFDAVTREIMHGDKVVTQGYMYDLLYSMAERTLISPGMSKFAPIAEAVAMERRVNALADKLRALPWDNVHRPLGDYAGVKRSRWSEAAFRVWMLGMVRRILEPGCQHDIMLVLEGPQGIKKTSFLRILGEALGFDGYAEVEKLSSSDNGMMILDGKYLVELSEMVAHRQADREAFKKTLTSKKDRYRRPYAKRFDDMPRTCVFAGTTNKLDNYLKDPTGHRRIAPVKVEDEMRLDDLERDATQIFAEHVTLYHRLKVAGVPINWFSKTEEAWQAEETSKRVVLDVFADDLDDLLAKPENRYSITNRKLYEDLGIAMDRRRQFQEEIKAAMEHRGWQQTPRIGNTDQGRKDGVIWRRLEKPEERGT